jgi:hypothetical protein
MRPTTPSGDSSLNPSVWPASRRSRSEGRARAAVPGWIGHRPLGAACGQVVPRWFHRVGELVRSISRAGLRSPPLTAACPMVCGPDRRSPNERFAGHRRRTLLRTTRLAVPWARRSWISASSSTGTRRSCGGIAGCPLEEERVFAGGPAAHRITGADTLELTAHLLVHGMHRRRRAGRRQWPSALCQRRSRADPGVRKGNPVRRHGAERSGAGAKGQGEGTHGKRSPACSCPYFDASADLSVCCDRSGVREK